MRNLRICSFGLLCIVAGAAIMYLSSKPQIVTIAAEPRIVYVTTSSPLVTPETDLAAQKTTYRIIYDDPIWVEYLQAESVYGYENMIWFCDEDGCPIRVIPCYRLRNIVRFNIGEKWADKP